MAGARGCEQRLRKEARCLFALAKRVTMQHPRRFASSARSSSSALFLLLDAHFTLGVAACLLQWGDGSLYIFFLSLLFIARCAAALIGTLVNNLHRFLFIYFFLRFRHLNILSHLCCGDRSWIDRHPLSATAEASVIYDSCPSR